LQCSTPNGDKQTREWAGQFGQNCGGHLSVAFQPNPKAMRILHNLPPMRPRKQRGIQEKIALTNLH
jgi:hypothetical protein